jgi:hypothetical protein
MYILYVAYNIQSISHENQNRRVWFRVRPGGRERSDRIAERIRPDHRQAHHPRERRLGRARTPPGVSRTPLREALPARLRKRPRHPRQGPSSALSLGYPRDVPGEGPPGSLCRPPGLRRMTDAGCITSARSMTDAPPALPARRRPGVAVQHGIHQALSDASGNQARLHPRTQEQALRYIYLSVLSHLATSMKEHERISALQKRDRASGTPRAGHGVRGKALYHPSNTAGETDHHHGS